MIAATEVRLVLVTPETTLLDQSVRSIRFPLFDGQFGVLPGRAPVVGRLGNGELTFDGPGGSGKYYIDGGFLQIKGQVVTILTNRAIAATELKAETAQVALDAASKLPSSTEAEYAAKQLAIAGARKMQAMLTSRGTRA